MPYFDLLVTFRPLGDFSTAWWLFDLDWPWICLMKIFYLIRLLSVESGECVKNLRSAFAIRFFRQGFSFILISIQGVKMKFQIIMRNCCRFSYKVFRKIYLKAFGLHRDNPPAWELIEIIGLKKSKIFYFQMRLTFSNYDQKKKKLWNNCLYDGLVFSKNWLCSFSTKQKTFWASKIMC